MEGYRLGPPPISLCYRFGWQPKSDNIFFRKKTIFSEKKHFFPKKQHFFPKKKHFFPKKQHFFPKKNIFFLCPIHLISFRFGHFGPGPTETDITVLSFRLANRGRTLRKTQSTPSINANRDKENRDLLPVVVNLMQYTQAKFTTREKRIRVQRQFRAKRTNISHLHESLSTQ